jgi:flavin reductase (DIM6/NTAB) family NADH-FMN oxidoreductase RutF
MLEQTNIEKALKFRHPEIVVNVVTRSKENIIDVTPIGWAMLGFSNPRTWAIGIAKIHYSHKAILDTKEFTVCLPSARQAEDTYYCGTHSAWKVDKLKDTKFKILDAQIVKTPLIDNSLACFECKLINKMETADHTIFLGEIVAAHTSGKSMGLINIGKSRLVKFKRGKR